MSSAPALYVGTVRHRRFSRRHQFRYELFMVLLDVDRLPEAMSASRLASYNRWNWAAFDRDHIGLRGCCGIGSRQRRRGRRDARQADPAADAAPPDIFNPISIYCHDRAGDLRVAMADVRNTYGGRTQYWLRPESSPAPGLARWPTSRCTSRRSWRPACATSSCSRRRDRRWWRAGDRRDRSRPAAPRLFDATLTLRRQPWTARTVRRTLLRFRG